MVISHSFQVFFLFRVLLSFMKNSMVIRFFVCDVKCLNSYISVFHNFSFGKVSRIHKNYLLELQLFCWRHFSKTEVVQNTDIRN